MNILLKSVTIVDKSSKLHLKKRDVLITNGAFEKIAPKINNPDSRKELNFKGLHISQGWFDSSVSFGEPGFEERETIENGLKTAAKSGFTAVAVNSNTNPVTDSKSDILYILSKASHHPVSLYPIGALTDQGTGENLAELYDMKNAGAIAFYDYQKPVKNPNLLKIALQYTQSFNGLVIAYCNEDDVSKNGVVNEEVSSTKLGLKGIPALAEELHINRNLFLLEYTGGKLHIPTISTKKSVELIKNAKSKGLNVSCSVSVNNLILNDDALIDFNTNLKLKPPLRTDADKTALINALKEGIIDGVTSDHNPIDIEHKNVEFDNALFGSIGLESCFGALNTHFCLEDSIEFLTRLKVVFGIESSSISEGNKVNISLFNPNVTWKLEEKDIVSSSKNSALLGQFLKGKPLGVYANKKLILN
ncbi:dihydroorotase [uncultured Planktosalinus sp.]|uniref:dihydroorotase n=1 Tax=uncultured Planktosalinus sp. TaxID=1810935 RepID=UPI0030D8D5FA